ncbi:C6 zinc finger domain-containing protein [Colletotrichum karsti]|uniref:C6 zinc finger domain-containing protein n=1 Tax=Colletotrichum karsti TaxID=1095194 RepID=A0A9P6ID15_9PEZI|nr:C6 zinc finger domain-containing protein [Colletotrichum karsti]KAF9880132.1 C6 zinc finger domain-containing protein [Colletotrichum karsti]
MDPLTNHSLSASAQKKRRRPALACEACRRRKVRCDRNLPCGTCVRSKNALCTYTTQAPTSTTASLSLRQTRREQSPKHGEPKTGAAALALPEPILPAFQPLPTPRTSAPSSIRADDHAHTSPSIVFPGPTPSAGEHGPADFGLWQPVIQPRPAPPPPLTAAVVPQTAIGSVRTNDTASTPGSNPGSSSTVNSLVDRVRQLEQQLSDLVVRNEDRDETGVAGGAVIGQGLKYSRGCVSKTRFFGQSHWMNAADMLYRLVTFAKKFESDSMRSSQITELYQGLEKCKNLGRIIKARRNPSFATISIGKSIPTRDVADALVAAYLRTFESVQRVVHIPTFRADYERHWLNPADTPEPFLVLMQLVMAIGATFHDERFTLRNAAIQWFWEANFWLMTPCEKSRMTMTGLQIRVLMHHLRQTANIGCDLSWIGAGAVVRTAMYMGMHRDPRNLVKMSPYRAEMRRRLWATILEIALQTAVDAGGAPLIAMRDFDTEAPANLDDDQLVEDADSAIPVPKDAKTFTQMTVPLAIYAAFEARLAVTRRVNDFRSDTVYEETLRHSGELSAALQKMTQRLRAHHPAVSPFATRYAQFMTYRLFFALHQPIIPLALRNPMYYFSRKSAVDTALRLCKLAFLYPDESGNGPIVPANESELDFYRLTINGAGTYRSVPFQSVMTIGLELIHEKEEEIKNGTSLSFAGPEFRGILDAVADWSRSRIKSGETNIKGHALSVLIVAHLQVLEVGIDDDRVERHFEKACEDRVKECQELLGELAGDDVSEEGTGAPDIHDLEMDFDVGVDMLGDWYWDGMDNGGFISTSNFGNMDLMFP